MCHKLYPTYVVNDMTASMYTSHDYYLSVINAEVNTKWQLDNCQAP